MMNRKFTAREAWLLLLLSVMLLALFYYLALYRPVNLEVERCAALQVPVEEDLELQMMKATRKKKMVDELETPRRNSRGSCFPTTISRTRLRTFTRPFPRLPPTT